MKLFNNKNKKTSLEKYKNLTPAIKASICTGEKIAGFIDDNGKFEDIILIRTDNDLLDFCKKYNIQKEKIKTFW